jgi:hypothetical protein
MAARACLHASFNRRRSAIAQTFSFGSRTTSRRATQLFPLSPCAIRTCEIGERPRRSAARFSGKSARLKKFSGNSSRAAKLVKLSDRACALHRLWRNGVRRRRRDWWLFDTCRHYHREEQQGGAEISWPRLPSTRLSRPFFHPGSLQNGITCAREKTASLQHV